MAKSEFWKNLGGELLGKGLDIVTGGAISTMNDRRQIKQQKKLMAMETKNAKAMAQFNQGLALDMWNKTNYAAQVEQMKKAGLNVGLMYEGGGPGGTTAGAGQAQQASAGSAPAGGGEYGMALQMGIQSRLAAAQIKATEAQTAKTKAETDKISGVDTQQAETTIQAIIQNTANAAVQNELMQWEKQLKEIETNIAKENQWEIINQAKFATSKMIGEAQKALADGRVSEETANSMIEQIKEAATEQQLRISAQKAGLIKTGAETNAVNKSIQKMAAEIVNMGVNRQMDWEKLTLQQREVFVKERMAQTEEDQANFNTSTAAELKQWTSIITDIVKSME